MLDETINMVQNEKKFGVLDKAILDESLDRLKLSLGSTLSIEDKILQKPIKVASVFQESKTFFSDCELLRLTLMELIKLMKTQQGVVAINGWQEVARLKKSLVLNRKNVRHYLGKPWRKLNN